MFSANIFGDSSCSVFAGCSPQIQKVLTITLGAILVIASGALIAAGAVGAIPLLAGVISGVVLMAAVLSVVVFRLFSSKLISSVPPVELPVFDISSIEELIKEYREEFKLDPSMPYTVEYPGTISAGTHRATSLAASLRERMSERHPLDWVSKGNFRFLPCPVWVDLLHDREEIFAIVGKGRDPDGS